MSKTLAICCTVWMDYLVGDLKKHRDYLRSMSFLLQTGEVINCTHFSHVSGGEDRIQHFPLFAMSVPLGSSNSVRLMNNQWQRHTQCPKQPFSEDQKIPSACVEMISSRIPTILITDLMNPSSSSNTSWSFRWKDESYIYQNQSRVWSLKSSYFDQHSLHCFGIESVERICLRIP